MCLSSQHRMSMYGGIQEGAAAGLHERAFALLRRHVPAGMRVLDLGSGPGAFALRLHDAGYKVTACDLTERDDRPFPYRVVDLNGTFATAFAGERFDAISFVEVIEHLENPRGVFREIAQLLNPGGVLLLTTPNASGVYSRVRFFFTGQMSMFTDGSYGIGHGHITPLTVWQLEKVFAEGGYTILERSFHDAPFFPPRSIGDLAKTAAWIVC
jgi:SAM-dependent methyltransferase